MPPDKAPTEHRLLRPEPVRAPPQPSPLRRNARTSATRYKDVAMERRRGRSRRGLWVDSGESLRRKVAVRGQAPKSDGRCALLERARAEVLRVRRCHPEPADVLVSVEVTNPLSKPLELCTEV